MARASLACAVGGILCLWLAGCSDGGCTQGAARRCQCEAGATGLQICQADGSWGACDCSCEPDCGGKDCGPDGCGGSCGGCDLPPDASCIDAGTLRVYAQTGTCEQGRCAYESSEQACEFGCRQGACAPDPCLALDCSQSPSACQASPGRCEREPEPHCVYELLPDGSPCEDGLYCNGQESCEGGVCMPGEPPLDCSHLDDVCLLGVCDELGQGCTVEPRPDGTPCEDSLYCNGQESCQQGACASGQPVDCSELNTVCGQGECIEAWKTCVVMPVNDGESCADDLYCNGEEVCRGGYCTAEPIVCQQPANPCRQSVCEEPSRACVEQDRPDGTECDNRVACTLQDTCLAGACVTGETAPDGSPCRDEDPCTIDDVCEDGVCIAGEEICDEMVVVLMYMDGDNDLESYLVGDWHEMEAAGVESFAWLRVFVLMDRLGRNDAAMYEVLDGHSQQIEAPRLGLAASGMGEVNMGDGATVRDFILDVKDHVGTEAQYYLMLSDHGDGWTRSRAAPVPTTVRAVCIDESSGDDELSVAELREAISGQDLMLIAFDACLMGMAEVAYEMRNDALVMIASQETEPGDGWEFTELLSEFGQNGQASPEVFARVTVDTYINGYDNDYEDLTLASYDLTRMDELAAAADAVAAELTSLPSSEWRSVCNAMDWYGCFWMYCMPYTDLVHLVSRARSTDARDNDAVYDALLTAIDETVLYERHRRDHPNANGMNIYFPCEDSFNSNYNASHLQWAADTGWDEMLQQRAP
ncbi:MAG: hypothetical protein JXR96_18475 [Deltaproteobacteria bacterium]|nr:hypothetical protein [Deltaproteobacteria bacterium]